MPATKPSVPGLLSPIPVLLSSHFLGRRGVKADIARGDKMDLQPVLTIKPAHALILVLGGIFCGNIIRKTGFKPPASWWRYVKQLEPVAISATRSNWKVIIALARSEKSVLLSSIFEQEVD
ncbi:hypothetical protein SAMN05216411_103228 [Nitrosospira multiformis]|nr:hypothetical protein SAMN05216411_103228 [Nitrosospira multiformis]